MQMETPSAALEPKPPRPTRERILDIVEAQTKKYQKSLEVSPEAGAQMLEAFRTDYERIIRHLRGRPDEDDSYDLPRTLDLLEDYYPGFEVEDFELLLSLLPDPKRRTSAN